MAPVSSCSAIHATLGASLPEPRPESRLACCAHSLRVANEALLASTGPVLDAELIKGSRSATALLVQNSFEAPRPTSQNPNIKKSKRTSQT